MCKTPKLLDTRKSKIRRHVLSVVRGPSQYIAGGLRVNDSGVAVRGAHVLVEQGMLGININMADYDASTSGASMLLDVGASSRTKAISFISSHDSRSDLSVRGMLLGGRRGGEPSEV